MKHVTAAKWKMAGFWIPLLILLSPLIVVVSGIIYFLALITDALADEVRWAKYCDDYEEKERKIRTS